jgi:hypothetical protein
MLYSQFSKRLKSSLYGAQVTEEVEFQGETIAITEQGLVFVNGKETKLSSINEAIQYIKQIKFEEELAKDLYEDIPAVKIANIIREHHDVKVTNTLIETYIELASSKTFSIDPVILEIRSFNSIDSLIENKIDYLLDDGSVVAISEETQNMLNSLLEDKYQLVEYMQESKKNFMHVIKELS